MTMAENERGGIGCWTIAGGLVETGFALQLVEKFGLQAGRF